MTTLSKYLQTRILWLLLPPLWALFLFTIFWLYALPLPSLAYALAVCLVFSLPWLALDFYYWRRRHLQLQSLAPVLQVDFHQLPQPRNQIDADWTELFLNVCQHKQQQLEEVRQSNKQMQDYFITWGHQIKTPIAALRLQLQGEPLEQVQEIEQYVEMLLTYLHLEGQASDYVIRQCNLDEIVQQAVRHFAPQFIRRRLRLNYQPFEQTVLTDQRWLLFVLEQVLSNALKYTPDSTPSRENSISITLEPPLTLCLADTGIGIAPEDLSRIFDQGYTGINGRAINYAAPSLPNSPNFPGSQKVSGLGLYLCRRICAGLGHQISASSVPDQGTVIKIDLSSQERVWE